MIHYELQCPRSHRFDGWFQNSAAYATQSVQGLLECPICGDGRITQALMAPAVPRKGRARPKPEAVATETPSDSPPANAVVPVTSATTDMSAGHMPDHVRAMLQKLRVEVEKTCDYVGADFAAEARKIHNGDVAPRAIYGETTPEQAEALADDGIDVSRIPWVPPADS